MATTTDPNERQIREQAEQLRRIGGELKVSMSRAAETLESLGGGLRRPPQEEPESKVKPPPPPPKGKVLLLTCCMNTDVLQKTCEREGFEPCIYILTNNIDDDHDLVPDVNKTLKRILELLRDFPSASDVCLDWEDPLHRFLKAEWWGVEAAMLQFRQLRDRIYREFPQLLVSEWGLPMLPWWVYYHGRDYAINRAPEPALPDVLDEAAKCRFIWDYCEWLCPGVYTRHRSTQPETVNQWKFLVKKKMELCDRFGRGKPVYPCLCPFDQAHFSMDEQNYGLTAKDLLSHEEWKDVLRHVASFRPAGASMWCVKEWWDMNGVPDDALQTRLDLMEEILLR
jgi:hypothetical protein